jgi:hypothetical protein
MNETEKQARSVISELRRFIERIDEICKKIDGKNTFSYEEKEDLHELLSTLKNDLKVAKNRQELNNSEKKYFIRCISSASAHLTMKVNSDPIKSDWYSHLFIARSDISIILCQLEGQYP